MEYERVFIIFQAREPASLTEFHGEGGEVQRPAGFSIKRSGRASWGAESYLTVRYGAPSALVSHRHQRVADGLAWGRAFGHFALLSAGRAPRSEKTPLGVVIGGRSWKLVRNAG